MSSVCDTLFTAPMELFPYGAMWEAVGILFSFCHFLSDFALHRSSSLSCLWTILFNSSHDLIKRGFLTESIAMARHHAKALYLNVVSFILFISLNICMQYVFYTHFMSEILRQGELKITCSCSLNYKVAELGCQLDFFFQT